MAGNFGGILHLTLIHFGKVRELFMILQRYLQRYIKDLFVGKWIEKGHSNLIQNTRDVDL